MVAMVLLVIITGIVIQITNQTCQIWRSSTAKIQTFQDARAGFEAMSRKLSQATLNPYYDYYNSNNQARSTVALGLSGSAALSALAGFVPSTYDRYSDLHFISGQVAAFLLQGSDGNTSHITTQTHAVFFQAPCGYSANASYQDLDNALNACGYFLLFEDAKASVPPHIANAPGYHPRYRFRLMEMTQPTELLGIYAATGTAAQNDWFVKNAVAQSRIIAENVIALVLLPKLPASEDSPDGAGSGVSAAPNYNYNSRIHLNATLDPSFSSFPGDKFIAFPMTGGTASGSRHAQLPPIMRLVMIVIDEVSAARIQASGTTPPTGIDLTQTTLFTDASKLDTDIVQVENICNAAAGNLTGNTTRLKYRVFSTDIIMRNSKWSSK